jgi:hypothetical protein
MSLSLSSSTWSIPQRQAPCWGYRCGLYPDAWTIPQLFFNLYAFVDTLDAKIHTRNPNLDHLRISSILATAVIFPSLLGAIKTPRAPPQGRCSSPPFPNLTNPLYVPRNPSKAIAGVQNMPVHWSNPMDHEVVWEKRFSVQIIMEELSIEGSLELSNLVVLFHRPSSEIVIVSSPPPQSAS